MNPHLTIDNFEQIKKFMRFKNSDEFYVVQIIKRRKENPGMSRDSKKIYEFYINSIDYLERKKEDIIRYCKINNARAYISVVPRSYKRTCTLMQKINLENIHNEQYDKAFSAFSSACGKVESKPKNVKNLWILDVDGEFTEEYTNVILERQNDDFIHGTIEVVDVIDTLNGKHVIINPLNPLILEDIKTRYSIEFDIKKESPTLLYYTNTGILEFSKKEMQWLFDNWERVSNQNNEIIDKVLEFFNRNYIQIVFNSKKIIRDLHKILKNNKKLDNG